jgi:hypothetical protein
MTQITTSCLETARAELDFTGGWLLQTAPDSFLSTNDEETVLGLRGQPFLDFCEEIEIWIEPDHPATIGFDFSMDSVVSVQAPPTTDPETLIEAAVALFRERIVSGHADVQFIETNLDITL